MGSPMVEHCVYPDPPMCLYELLGKGEGTVTEVLQTQARARPEHPLLIWGDECWTYTQGLEEVGRVASLLHLHGVPGRSPRVASYLENQPAAMWTWLGTLWAGGLYVPLNHLHQGEILEDMLERAGADILVTDSVSLSTLPSLSRFGVRIVLVTDFSATELNDCQIADFN